MGSPLPERWRLLLLLLVLCLLVFCGGFAILMFGVWSMPWGLRVILAATVALAVLCVIGFCATADQLTNWIDAAEKRRGFEVMQAKRERDA